MGLSDFEKDFRKQKRRLEKWNREHKLIEGVDHKLCSRCKKYLPSNEQYFSINKLNGIDGLYPYCKSCNSKKSFIWITENREQFRENLNKYTKTLKRQKSMRENSKNQRLRGKQKEWQQNNPEKIKAYGETRSNKNHQISQAEWDACRQYFNFRCAYCNKTWEQNKLETKKDLHKEHVKHNGANDLSNCVPACQSCNSKKWEFTFEEWYNEENPVYTFTGKEKILKWLKEEHLKYILKCQ